MSDLELHLVSCQVTADVVGCTGYTAGDVFRILCLQNTHTHTHTHTVIIPEKQSDSFLKDYIVHELSEKVPFGFSL